VNLQDRKHTHLTRRFTTRRLTTTLTLTGCLLLFSCAVDGKETFQENLPVEAENNTIENSALENSALENSALERTLIEEGILEHEMTAEMREIWLNLNGENYRKWEVNAYNLDVIWKEERNETEQKQVENLLEGAYNVEDLTSQDRALVQGMDEEEHVIFWETYETKINLEWEANTIKAENRTVEDQKLVEQLLKGETTVEDTPNPERTRQLVNGFEPDEYTKFEILQPHMQQRIQNSNQIGQMVLDRTEIVGELISYTTRNALKQIEIQIQETGHYHIEIMTLTELAEPIWMLVQTDQNQRYIADTVGYVGIVNVGESRIGFETHLQEGTYLLIFDPETDPEGQETNHVRITVW